MYIALWIVVAYEECYRFWRMGGWINVTEDVKFGSCQPSPYERNILVLFINLSAHCCSDQVAIQAQLGTVCLLKVKGTVFSTWMFSLEGRILLKAPLAVVLPICSFASPILGTCLCSLQGQLRSFISLLIQNSCYHRNTTCIFIMKARREAPCYLFSCLLW